jgi:hypothetical protein
LLTRLLAHLPLASHGHRRKAYRLFQIAKVLIAFIAMVFVVPAAYTAAWWSIQDRPSSWRAADWSSSGVLQPAAADPDAAIYVLAARTGGLKGALSLHSWIVTKAAGDTAYQRFDKVGWGNPIRRNGYPADAFWYSNRPSIIRSVSGEQAEGLLAKVEEAIASYPYSASGDYHIWPGPNSNSFVAHVLAQVPELGGPLPPNAIGRDFAPGLASLRIAPDWRDVHATFGGLAGFAFGARSGLEIHFLGLVVGFDSDPR